MLVKEYRIPFPATLEDYRIGMLYAVARATDEENRKKKGKTAIEVVKRERYFDHERGIHGIYTEKVFHIRNLLPRFIKVFVPESKSILIEKAWNGYPDRCFTLFECPFLGDAFHLSIETRYVGNDTGVRENALGLSDEELEQREVVDLNIGSEELLRMTPETDVRELHSTKADCVALDAGGMWIRKTSPIMCSYRVARLGISSRALPGSRIEKWGHRNGLQTAFLRYNRQVFCWMDCWLGLDVSDVDGLNDNAKEKRGFRSKMEAAASSLATEIAAESSAGLAFAFSDESNPFFA